MRVTAHLIVEVRRRAGLTQRALARRLDTHQPVIARWESGVTEPSLATVRRVCRACGFDLQFNISPADDHDVALIRRQLRLLPHQRLSDMVEAVNAFSAMKGAVDARL